MLMLSDSCPKCIQESIPPFCFVIMAMPIVKKVSQLWDGYNNFERIFWAIVFTASFYGMSIYCYYTIQRYYSDPVSMTSDTKFVHRNLSFPAVSICLVKGKSALQLQSAISELNISYSQSENSFLKTVHNCMFANPNQLYPVFKKCEELRSKYGVNIGDLKKKSLPRNCKIFMDLVYYDKKRYDCRDIFKFRETELGYCFIANSIADHGYTFKNLKLEYSLWTKNRRLSIRLKVFKLWQYALHVHSQEELPFYNSVSKEVFATEMLYSFNVDIVLIDQEAAKQSISQRGCRFPHEKLIGSPFHYSFSSCMSFLRMQQELQECNCTLSTSPAIYSSQYCDLSGIKCLSNGDVNNRALRLAMDNQICVPSCIELIIRYAGQSEMRLETNPYYTDISVEICSFPLERYKRSIIRTKLDLAVSIAGLAGLFFGVSVLNLVEVIYFAVTAK